MSPPPLVLCITGAGDIVQVTLAGLGWAGLGWAGLGWAVPADDLRHIVRMILLIAAETAQATTLP